MIYSLFTFAFILGYSFMVFEKKIKIDKAASAIMKSVVCRILLSSQNTFQEIYYGAKCLLHIIIS